MNQTRLRLYRRHVEACRFKSRGQYYTGCDCPIWAIGEITGMPYRRSLGIRDWNTAVRHLEDIEREPEKALRPRITITAAIESYINDCRARGLAAATIVRYGKVLTPFLDFCKSRGAVEMYSLTVPLLTQYRASRELASSTQRTELECLRAFCGHCVTHGWLASNPAKALKPPVDDSMPTLPFSKDEVRKLLTACNRLSNRNSRSALRARLRARALLLTLLYSGLRISDVGKLRQSTVTEDGRLFLRTMKTESPVYVRLPESVLDALHALPRESDEYFFWSGRGKLSSVLGSMRRTVERLGELTQIPAHPHRFRDTFAVRLLEKGVSIRTVQILLGHSNVTTTEKHYAPFMRSHQKLLDDAVELLDFEG